VTTFTGSIPTIASGDTTTVPTSLATYRDALKALSEAWTAYTPAWTATGTNPTLGNGTIVGHYSRVNKRVDFWIKLTVGSTTSIGSGTYILTLPVAPISGYPCHFEVVYTDASTGFLYRGVTYSPSGLTVALAYDQNGATNTPLQPLSDTTPVAPASGDVYEVSGTYEAA
jgi:hypothetical protein